MKITGFDIIEIEVTPKGNWVFVQIQTDAGISGLGEASQSGKDTLVQVVLKQLEAELMGKDPTNIIALWEQMVHPDNVFSGDAGRVGATAISAIDQALWDIKGKAFDVPVWQLLGGKHRDKVRLYANLNRGITDRRPEGFAEAAQRAVESGFGAIKCTPFDEVKLLKQDRSGVEKDLKLGIDRVSAIRDTVGSEIDLMVDCHSRFDLPLARRACEALKPLNLYWLEEPVASEQTQAMKHLCQHSGHTIAGGEAFLGRNAFWETLAEGAMHVIMPDVKHAGGISECMRIAAMAEIKQIMVSPHSPAGPVSNMAGVHLAAAIPSFLMLEYAFGEVEWRSQLTAPEEHIENGFMSVPDRPGLGIELNQVLVKAHQV
jgi:galactonate dehydratase